MRNPTDVLNSLSKQSKNPTYKFQRLYRNLYNPEFYLLAYKNIYANEGSMTPGVDGETLDGMSSPRIKRTISALQDRSYRPNPARRTYIAKKGNSKSSVRLAFPPGTISWCRKSSEWYWKAFMNPHFPISLTDSAPIAAATQS